MFMLLIYTLRHKTFITASGEETIPAFARLTDYTLNPATMKTNRLPDKPTRNFPQKGQPDPGFELLYEQYGHKVYQKCLTMTGDSEEAHDHTQDIFLKVFTKLGDFQQRSSLSTWLFSITHNHCVDTIKRRNRYKTESLTTQLSEHAETSLPETDEDHVFQVALLKQLPEVELTLLKLKYEQHLSVKEISEHYGIQECAVKMRLKRTRDRLKTLYAAYQNQPV